MATGVGLRIADDECVAAIVVDGAAPQYVAREAVLHMSPDGDATLGGAAPGNTDSLRGFVAAVGDPAGIPVEDGEAFRAEDLLATAAFCLINETTELLAGAAEFYATYPGDWAVDNIAAVREALDYLGLKSVTLINAAELPATGTTDPGRAHAAAAAHAALTAVLATPAGSTPPDPHVPENSQASTDAIPEVPRPDDTPKAYSAASPEPGHIAAPTPAQTSAPTPTTAFEATPEPEARTGHKKRNRNAALAAAAALAGLAVGAAGVALVTGNSDSGTPGADPLPTSEVTAEVPPPPGPPIEPPPEPVAPEPVTPEPAAEPPAEAPVEPAPEPPAETTTPSEAPAETTPPAETTAPTETTKRFGWPREETTSPDETTERFGWNP